MDCYCQAVWVFYFVALRHSCAARPFSIRVEKDKALPFLKANQRSNVLANPQHNLNYNFTQSAIDIYANLWYPNKGALLSAKNE
jgi:hypothetical protein